MTAVREAPLYVQVAARILSELGPGLESGTRLPSERVLCEQFEVSRVTMRAALQLLAQDGVLTSAAARGWFVTDAGSLLARQTPPNRLRGFSDLAAVLGQSTSATVLAAESRPATIDEAELFSIVPGSAVFELRRLRRLEDLIIAVDHSRVPLMLCPGIADHDFSTASLYQVLRSAPEPVEPTLADYAVEALAPSAEEAALLDLPPGVPLLVATQQTRDQLGRICELGRTLYRGDRFRFRASLGVAG